MPFPFTLPTTSALPFSDFAQSSTHPSLPQTASTYRAVLRSVLKKHKHLASQSRASNLSTVLAALNDYVPYLLVLDAGLCGRSVGGEEIDVVLKKEIDVEWRTTLTATVNGREIPRVKGRGLDYEISFALQTLACVYTLQARGQLLALYGSITPTDEQRIAIVTTATKQLLQANSIHNFLASRSAEIDASSAVLETLSRTQGGLAKLALAEATLLAVLKDDPYPAVVAQARNRNDKDWMVKPPEIPKVRAHLFARLCLAAVEHAGIAEAMLNASGRIDEALTRYVFDLKSTSRAKACRFFGIDADLGGETGLGIAWLIGGKMQLGFAGSKEEGSKMKGLAKFKKDWTERREDKKIEKGGKWGSDAGRLEELRVIEMLEQKWNKMNDTINTQLIPLSDPLVANMPLGRNIHSTKPFVPPSLGEDILAHMRAPPDVGEMGDDDSSSSDEDGKAQRDLPGAFPGSSMDQANENSYY
ncbi:MAG: hypothetical protein ASARMPREDX12_007582 [Alectoria sarmentosa]|nr:MAG: hypothetical protein ASARMPRED_003785 [Alectoria sarmentosa]CAD6575792.1 MAG: hypothetical protein ASARMPREDX12_007582 [Alectoria sarmentosa]